MTDEEESIRSAAASYPSTLRITVASGDDAFDAALEDAVAAESDRGPAEEAVRAFESLADLRRLLTERRLEVLRSVHADPPSSISALADRLDRPYKVVHEDVGVLADHAVIRFEAGPGNAKRPFVPYESVRIDVPLLGEFEVPEGSEFVDRAGAG